MHPNNPQINTGDKTGGFPTENNPHVDTTSALGILDTTKGGPGGGEVEIIARASRGDEPSTTSAMSLSDIKPDTGHTHTDSYTGHKNAKPRTIHTETRNSGRENTTQPTRKCSHRNIITDSTHGRDSKGTLQPDTLSRGPVPTPDETQGTMADNTARPIAKTVTRVESISAHITVNSSVNDSENDDS